MFRQVVHLPPVSVSRPERSMWIVWSRERAAVLVASPVRTRGRIPTNTLRTSLRVMGLRRYRPWLERRLGDRRVGRADESVAVPGDREHDAPVARVGHHDGAPSWQVGPVEDEVDPLAGDDERRKPGLGQAPDGVAEGPGRVDHDAGPGTELSSALEVARHDAVHEAVRIPRQAGHRCVVEERRPLLGGGGGHVDEEPRVVELPIVVDDPSPKPLRADRGQPLEGLLLREDLRSAEAVAAGEEVVDLEAETVEGGLPPLVVRHHEGEVAYQVGRVPAQQAPLLEGLHDQRDVPLLEVADPAVGELGRAAGGALAEVGLLQEQQVVTPGGGVERHRDPGRPAAHDDHVPGLAPSQRAAEHLLAVHGASPVPTRLLQIVAAGSKRDGRTVLASATSRRWVRNSRAAYRRGAAAASPAARPSGKPK
jgi:hypothetical protein